MVEPLQDTYLEVAAGDPQETEEELMEEDLMAAGAIMQAVKEEA